MRLPDVDAVPISTGAAAVYRVKDHPTLGAEFTWEDRNGEPYLAFRERLGHWFLPRAACPMGLRDDRAAGDEVEFKEPPEPRDADQRLVYQSALARLHLGHSGVIEAPTGWGKTWLALSLAAALGRRTLVVVPKSDLLGERNWGGAVREFLGEEPGLIRANKVDVRSVTLATLQSVCKENRYPPDVLRKFGLVIFDEVHRLAADHFQGACFEIPARLRLGLSADSRRWDRKEVLLAAHLGPLLARGVDVPMRPKVLRYETGWKVPRDRKGNQVPHSPGKDMHVVRILSRNQDRNELILSLVRAAHARGRRLVVFSHRQEHLGILSRMLGDLPHAFYTGKQSAAELDAAAGQGIILATYQMAKEGTNTPAWDACLLATPISNAKQAVGRILRKAPGKKQPAVMDLVDGDSYVYRRYAEKRDAYYREVEAGPVLDLEA